MERLSDAQLILVTAMTLFALSAWPLLLVQCPPLQDLPNHVATAHILAHRDLYPGYVFNGFFKSNSLLTSWLHLWPDAGLFPAARVFTAVVLALKAVALPLFVRRFAGRQVMLVASFFLWPLVHSYFVSMGMLNFEFGFALSLILLTIIDRQREHPTLGRSFGVGALACLVWFAHPLPTAVVAALVAFHAARRSTWRERFHAALALLVPLAPAALLSLGTAIQHVAKVEHAPLAASTAYVFLTPWDLLSRLWSCVSGALTRWGSMTIVPAVLLPYFAWHRRRVARPLLSLWALAGLAVGYVGLPIMFSNWWYLNCRLVAFLWVGLALRLPEDLPRPIAGLLLACALSFSAVLGVDYVRLDRDRAEFTAGIAAVPERATLLPLMFKHSKTSDFTASMTHAWAFYTLEKNTSAPLVFAVERSYPITYQDFPPPALVPPTLDSFAEQNRTPAETCKALHGFPIGAACTAAWRELWSGFWREAEPRFTHVLTWAMPPEARTQIPGRYQRVFAEGELEIYARGGSPASPGSP